MEGAKRPRPGTSCAGRRAFPRRPSASLEGTGVPAPASRRSPPGAGRGFSVREAGQTGCNPAARPAQASRARLPRGRPPGRAGVPAREPTCPPD